MHLFQLNICPRPLPLLFLAQPHPVTGQSMLVPLTGSMYIAGTVAEPSHVLIDVGAGYYIERGVAPLPPCLPLHLLGVSTVGGAFSHLQSCSHLPLSPPQSHYLSIPRHMFVPHATCLSPTPPNSMSRQQMQLLEEVPTVLQTSHTPLHRTTPHITSLLSHPTPPVAGGTRQEAATGGGDDGAAGQGEGSRAAAGRGSSRCRRGGSTGRQDTGSCLVSCVLCAWSWLHVNHAAVCLYRMACR
ncbi:unnamed protein product [Closterium sp. NIES-54]